MKTKLINLILTATMTLSSVAVTVHGSEYNDVYQNEPTGTYYQIFNDVPSSHWAFSYIGAMVERNVIDGYLDGNFYPDNMVTRAEFAKIMMCAAKIPVYQPAYKYFQDVEINAWYAPYVHSAYPFLSGYVYGNNRYYMPDEPALREDIAVALVKLKGYDNDYADTSVLNTMFTDVNSISLDARKYVAIAVERGLVSGYDDNTFRGQASITRAEAAAMLWRAYQYGNDNKIFDDENFESRNNNIATPSISPSQGPAESPNQINTPTPEPTATSTPAPTPTPTPIPTATPTPEPTLIPESPKPYEMDTITKADVDSSTCDNNDNIYYFDKSENVIYMLNMDSESISKVIDLENLTMREDGKFDYEITENNDSDLIDGSADNSENEFDTSSIYNDGILEYYKNFNLYQLYYDNVNNVLLANGSFRSITDWQDYKDHSTNKEVLLDITDGDNPKLYSELEIDGKIETVLDNGYILDSHGNIYDFQNQEIVNRISMNGSGDYILQKDNKLYSILLGTEGSGTSAMTKYDFVSTNWKYAREDTFEADVVGIKNDEYYLWELHGKILRLDTNGVLYDTGIDTHNDIEIIDMMSYPPMPYIGFDSETYYVSDFYVSDNGKYIFYDKANKAIRVIRKR